MTFHCTSFTVLHKECMAIAATLKARSKEIDLPDALKAELEIRATCWEQIAARIAMTTGFQAEQRT